MATYAIGDLQGCYTPLQQLLDKLSFDPASDTLWFVGDLVNRGPESLQTLRFVRSLGNSAISVLGNHDLNLLAVAEGIRRTKSRDTLQDILEAPDRDELLHWIRHLPLFHHDSTSDFSMLHAGLPPQWNLDTAQTLANEAESWLRSNDYSAMLNIMYGDQPDTWSDDLPKEQRIRFITNCFTRLRFCSSEGKLAIDCKKAPGQQPDGFMPWFDHPQRKSKDMKIIFGHWSALGVHITNNVYALDSGCVWGGELTALRIDIPIPELVSVNCA